MLILEPIAIFTFPLIAFLIFSAFRLEIAVCASFLFGYLLLPPRYVLNIPLLPDISKSSIVSISVAAAAMLWVQSQRSIARTSRTSRLDEKAMLPGLLPRSSLLLICLAVLLVAPVGTWLVNMQGISLPDHFVPALSAYDAASMLQSTVLSLIPFFLGRKFLATDEGNRVLVFSVVTAGLLYSLPTLAEVRLSPQIHNWTYGYFQHSWLQHRRGDGFRPVVYLSHALELGLFLVVAIIACFGAMRSTNGDRRILFLVAGFYLLAVLVLAKSLGALLIALTLLPVILFLPVRLVVYAAAVLAFVVLLFPLVRATGISPFAAVSALIEPFAPGRADSLNYRLLQENEMLENVLRKPIFGWGGYGRMLTVPEEELATSVRDGFWLIRFGERGFAGYMSFLGLVTIPILALAARARHYNLSITTAALALALGANLIDLIPNSSLTLLTLLMGGALAGRLEIALGRVDVGQQSETRSDSALNSPALARNRAQSARKGRQVAREGSTLGKTATDDVPSRKAVAHQTGPSYSRFAPRQIRRRETTR